jgi:hypothetical protein
MGVPVARTSQRAYANGDKGPNMVMRSISLSRIKRSRREADPPSLRASKAEFWPRPGKNVRRY